MAEYNFPCRHNNIIHILLRSTHHYIFFSAGDNFSFSLSVPRLARGIHEFIETSGCRGQAGVVASIGKNQFLLLLYAPRLVRGVQEFIEM
jgi:hypothetical protein